MAKEPTKIKIEKEIETNKVEGTVLGQRVSAPTTYTPDILVAVPREDNRKDYGITNENIAGYDDWDAYECSTITTKGAPVYFGILIRYPANSEFIVESKSLKLYLNSFNMEQLADTVEKTVQEFVDRVQKDLSELLKTNVYVESFTTSEAFVDITEQFEDLSSIVDYNHIVVDSFNENPDTIEVIETPTNISWKFNGLRSRCKITSQPDYSTVYIHVKGNKAPNPASLVRYLTSFRNEDHFHEECCEMVYKRLLDKLNPESLWVRCNYTRRGGIGINPTRYIPSMNDATPPSRTVYQ